MKARLGLVVPAFDQGGGVPSVAMFVRRVALASGRYEVRVLSLATARDDACSVRLAAPSTWLRGATMTTGEWSAVPYTHVGAIASELEFQRYRPRAALTQALADCDLIQVVCGSPAWANTVVGLGKPVALQVATRAKVERVRRNARHSAVKGRWRAGMTHVTDWLDDRALRHVGAIQVENPWMLEYASSINGTRAIDIRYAPPGIDADWYQPIVDHARLREPYILCVGRLEDPRKNINLLLMAYAQLPAAVRANVRVVLAGSSPPPATFWQRAEAMGVRTRIEFADRPSADTLLKLYQHASAFALPSDEEGFGMVVIEAMACGVPVVATRCGGPDGIITDGKDGYLVPRGDAAAMSGRLATLLQNPAQNEAVGRAARATIERRYDERIAGAIFVDMWDRLLEHGAPR